MTDRQTTRQNATLADIIRGRHSVRRFQERPVPHQLLIEILEAARWAPSPHGRQPWRFVVLSEAASKIRLAEAMGEEWQRQLAMDGQDQARVEERLRISRMRIRTAPVLIVPCLYLQEMDHYPDLERQRAEEIMAIQSLGCAVQNLLLSAYALGLDAGWMCAPLFCPQVVQAALDLEQTLIPHALIPIGYAAVDPVRRPHKPIEELVLWR